MYLSCYTDNTGAFVWCLIVGGSPANRPGPMSAAVAAWRSASKSRAIDGEIPTWDGDVGAMSTLDQVVQRIAA